MTKNTSTEASHAFLTEGLVATLQKTSNTTEAEEDTALFRKKLQRLLGKRFIAAATKKDRNLRPLINFDKKRDWEANKTSYGPYWHNIRDWLHIREDCLLIDERIVITTQLRQIVLDSLRLLHPGCGGHVGSVPTRLVPSHTQNHCPHGTKLQAFTEQGKT